MTLEENKTIVRRFIDAYNTKNLTLFDELVAPDYIDHTHQQKGRDAFVELFTLSFDVFPDWHESIQDIIAEEDKVWVRAIATGTHKAKWNHFGVRFPPTGKKLKMEMVFYWRIANGKLIECGEVDDSLGFLK